MKIVLNLKLWALFLEKIVLNVKLSTALKDIIAGGFILHNECYFIKTLYKNQTHINESDFIDKTGYECFINSIHIDDYVEFDKFEQAILFADKLIVIWRIQNIESILNVIISKTEFGFNIKFHILRKGEKWIIENDINKFNEAILVINSCR